jgi:hypothetical protein
MEHSGGVYIPMYKLIFALLSLQLLASAVRDSALAAPAAQMIVSPDGALHAIISPNDRNRGFGESRVEIRESGGKLICAKDYSSSDGQHGYAVNKAQWTADSRFFVYDMQSSGGHQPYRSPTFFYSRQNNRIRDIEELTHRAVLDQGPEPTFKIVPPHSVAIASSPTAYSGKGFDTDHDIIILVDLETGAISQQSKWPSEALP